MHIKTALDALKARQMAKSIGLEPEAGSQWRWALRNLRNMHTGEPLQGDELEAAKISLGKMPTHVREGIHDLSASTGHRKEVAQAFYASEPDVPEEFIGDRNGVDWKRKDIGEDVLMRHIHTHPYTPASNAYQKKEQIWGLKQQLKKLPKNVNEETKRTVRTELQKRVAELARLDLPTPALVSPSGYKGRAYERSLQRMNDFMKSLSNFTRKADYGVFTRINMGDPHANSVIYNPEFGFESTHKIRDHNLRSLYWSGNQEAIDRAQISPNYQPLDAFLDEGMREIFPSKQDKINKIKKDLMTVWLPAAAISLPAAGLQLWLSQRAKRKAADANRNTEKAAFVSIDGIPKYAELLEPAPPELTNYLCDLFGVRYNPERRSFHNDVPRETRRENYDRLVNGTKKEADEEFIGITKGNNDEKYNRLLKRLRERRNPPTLLLAADAPLAKEAASFGARHAIPIALSVPLALAAWKDIHSAIVAGEPRQDIRTPLVELASRKEKTQAVRTAFEDRFNKLSLKDVDDEKTKIQVGRSMFPWRDAYSVDVDLKDRQGESIGEWPGYSAKVFKDKDGAYTGLLDMIFTKEPMQGKGIGTVVENKMVDAFRDVGATKARLLPAFDGPLVWAKEKFNYRLSPNSKDVFLTAYKAYAKEKGIPFKDLGDKPSDYPEEFLKTLKDYEPTFRNSYYEKEIKGPLAKQAASFDARRGKQYWQLLKRLHGGNDEAVEAIKETRDPGIYHGTESENVPSIMSNGFVSGHRQAYGTGTYFGTKNIASEYGEGHSGNKEKALLRLALPSELKGTKHLYPNSSSVHTYAPENSQSMWGYNFDSMVHNYTNKLPELDKAHEANDKHNYLVVADALEKFKDRKRVKGLDTHPKMNLFNFVDWQENRVKKGLANPNATYAKLFQNLQDAREKSWNMNNLLRSGSNAPEHHQLSNYGKWPNGEVDAKGIMHIGAKGERENVVPSHLIRQAAQIFLGIEKG
jgi:GNAT superfamily N-acetyltransferase